MAIISFQVGSFNHSNDGPSVSENGDTSAFTQVNFPSPFPAGSTPVIVPYVQTFNGCNTPGLRIADVTNTGFKVRLNELVVSNDDTPSGAHSHATSDGFHHNEIIGYIAFLPTS